MIALTIWQPWAWCILHAGRRVEHRTWAPPPRQLKPGQFFAVHAGRHDENAASLIRRALRVEIPEKSRLPTGAIVGVAEFLRVIEANAPSDQVPEMAVPWWDVSRAWVLGEVIAFSRPIEARGLQGLWSVPHDIAELAAAEARRCRSQIRQSEVTP